jgi:hypothetical protein
MTDDLRELIDRRVRALLDLPLRDPILHGTETAYVKLLCRCDPCRAAASAARLSRNLRDPEAYRDAQRRAYHLRKGREALPPPMHASERSHDGPAV